MLKRWGNNFKKEMTDTAGVVSGLGTVGGGFASAVIIPAYAPFVTGGIAAVGVLYAAIKSYPKKLIKHSDILNETVHLNQLVNVEPIKKVGLVGLSNVGKTTLIKSMQCKTPSEERTDELFATILSVLHTDKYIALVDGAGQELVQQFEILKNVDILFIVIDHNDEDKTFYSQSRLKDQEDFIDQIVKHLNYENTEIRIHILINKHDKWGKSKKQGTDIMVQFSKKIEDYFDRNPNLTLTRDFHSNFKVTDIGKVWDIIKAEV